VKKDPELGAVERLTAGLEPPAHRDILVRCLSGTLSPAVALMQLLIETEDASAVRATVDEVTRRAASLSRATDSLLRDRVDDLTQLVVENEPGCEKIAGMLRANVDSPAPARSVEEGIAFCEKLFDWSVQQSEEASVALYSLGNPQLIEDVLVKHPKMKIQLMHMGFPYLQETKAILNVYPQVYADIAGIDWLRPVPEFYSYLKSFIEGGFGKRIMYGSDQMAWEDAIPLSIKKVEDAPFLTEEQKQDIFYNNAAKFYNIK